MDSKELLISLNDLEINTEITIIVSKNTKRVALNSDIIKSVSSDVLTGLKEMSDGDQYTTVAVMEVDDKILNFDANNLKIQIIANCSGKSYFWNNARIQIVRFENGEVYHLITSTNGGQQFNRRNSYRLWVGKEGTAALRDSGAHHDIIVKDISVTGIGIIISSEYMAEIGDTVKIQFKDHKYSDIKKNFVDELYTVDAEVVRIVHKDEYTDLVGCELHCDITQIAKFIAMKQRERARIGGRKAIYKQGRDTELLEKYAKMNSNNK